MSLKNRPTGGTGASPLSPIPSTLERAVELLRTHVRTWPARYVEMRVDARTGDRDRPR